MPYEVFEKHSRTPPYEDCEEISEEQAIKELIAECEAVRINGLEPILDSLRKGYLVTTPDFAYSIKKWSVV